MTQRSARTSWSGAAVLAAALALAPVGWHGGIASPSAFAAPGGNGGGNGGGNDAGNAGGHGGGQGKGGNSGNAGQAGQKGGQEKSGQQGRGRTQDAKSKERGGAVANRGKAAAALGNLNAANASATARSRAAAGSMVGKIAAYETQMKAALATEDPNQRAAAIAAARQGLALSANKQLTGPVVTRVDGLLGLPASPAHLGTVQATPRLAIAAPARDRSASASTPGSHGKAAAALGNLNAAHASAVARGRASPGSMVGQIATYETQMKAALAIEDPSRRAAAVAAARQDLALSANRQLTPAAVTRVDGLLGLPATDGRLGTTAATSSRL